MIAYEQDRFAWSEEQAKLLTQHERAGLDRTHIAAEIEHLGQADVDTLRERIAILMKSLLRWAYEVDLRSVALNSTIFVQRHEIGRLLEESPSLVPLANEMVVEVYPEARRAASVESGPFEDSFPAGLPFLPREVFDSRFLPDPYGDDEIRGEGWWRAR